jgi:CubicO group peptidase (beta-lactamase class C family)
MDHAYVDHAPAGVSEIPGHRSTGEITSAWHFTPELGGFGGVRATLDDVIRYAQAQLGHGDAHTVDVLARTHAAVDLGFPRPTGDPEMAMAWIREPFDGRTVLAHNGGTGGFTSVVVIDPDAERASVLLSDTQLDNLGGLGNLAQHLLDPTTPLEAPRMIATPSPALLAALAGHYQVGGIDVTLSVDADALVATLADGSEVTLEYDSHGDFFTHALDILITPERGDDGQQTFALVREGEPTLATRLSDPQP